MNRENLKILFLFIKCIAILILLGSIVPSIIEYIFFSEKTKFHGNSILVYNIISNNKCIIYNYIHLLKLIISV